MLKKHLFTCPACGGHHISMVTLLTRVEPLLGEITIDGDPDLPWVRYLYKADKDGHPYERIEDTHYCCTDCGDNTQWTFKEMVDQGILAPVKEKEDGDDGRGTGSKTR